MKTNSAEFKALQAKWNKKLKDSGFEDAEQPNGLLKKWSSKALRFAKNPDLIQAKQEYYNLADEFLAHHSFETKLQYVIWEAHCQGLGVREICKLPKIKRRNMAKTQVWERIRDLTKIMHKKA